MRMRLKALIIIGFLWICLLALPYLQVSDSKAFYLTMSGVLSLLFIASLLVLYNHTRQLLHTNQRLQDKLNEQNAKNVPIIEQPQSQDNISTSEHLTLPNRIQFNESLNKAIAHARRHHKFLAILAISLDDFDKSCSALDQSEAKNALTEIGRRLTSTLRTDDILTKLEGEEFVVLLNDIGKPKYAGAVAEKLIRACSMPININNHIIRITPSIGISIFPTDGDSLESLFKNMNDALEQVKRAGGNNYQFHQTANNIEAREYIQLGEALKAAISNNELTLHYQPRHHVKRGTIAGVESLIRWTHPKHGNIDPAIFIPLAEETNLIIPIGEWALLEACKTNKYWQDEGYHHFPVGVNLSVKQFNHPDLANMITRVLEQSGLSPDYLEIEISESAVMGDIDKTAAILNKIKETGVQISIDHFGVGYTSVTHLKRLPINHLKIDQSFIKGIPHNPNDVAIANSFIALAHNFGLEVVAEGVEVAEQVQYLLTQNCDMVQGYYFSYPLPADKIIEQFKKITEDVLI